MPRQRTWVPGGPSEFLPKWPPIEPTMRIAFVQKNSVFINKMSRSVIMAMSQFLRDYRLGKFKHSKQKVKS